jgi:hypothetical protein
MLFKVLERLINTGAGSKEDVQKKLDVFYAAGKLTEAEYAGLTERLGD